MTLIRWLEIAYMFSRRASRIPMNCFGKVPLKAPQLCQHLNQCWRCTKDVPQHKGATLHYLTVMLSLTYDGIS